MKKKIREDKISLVDVALFKKYQVENDHAAFNELYLKYERKIYYYCLRAFGNSEEASDTAQKIWLNVITHKLKFNGGSFLAWLLIITRNQCITEKRTKKYTLELNDFMDIEDTTVIEDFYEKDIVADVFDKIPEMYRDIVKLRFGFGYKYKEIVELTGLEMGLVKCRLSRAKKMLYDLLKDKI